MGSDIYVSSAGAVAALRDLDIIANNVANANTLGFKRKTPVFEVAMEAAFQNGAGGSVQGGAASSYVGSTGVATDFTAGSIITTGSKLDVAINGPGFFEIETPEGPRYTRVGTFRVGAGGSLSNQSGDPLMGEGGPIPVGTTPVEILSTGTVVDNEGAVVGVLKLVDFEDPSQLKQTGPSMFAAPDGIVPTPVEEMSFVAGSVEGSNVVSVRELTSLITVQRAFDIALRSLQADDRGTEQLLEEFMS